MTRAAVLLYGLPALLAAMPFVTSIVQLVMFAFVLMTCLLMAAHYWKAARLLARVEDLLSIAKAYQQLAGRQQVETQRLMTKVPEVTKAAVRETVEESIKAHADDTSRSGEMRVQTREAPGEGAHARAPSP